MPNSLRCKVALLARSFIGAPFRHQGRSTVTGMDCLGVVVIPGLRFGFQKKDYLSYKRIETGARLLAKLHEFYDEDPDKEIALANILVFRIGHQARHVGLRTFHGFVHNFSVTGAPGGGRVIEEPLAGRWMNRLHSVFTYRGIEA